MLLGSDIDGSIQLGLVGLGNNGIIHHAALMTPGQFDFALAAAADPASKVELDTSRTKLYSDFYNLLDDPDVDAVSINTPPNTHFSFVMAALEAGKHVLVEKPPALQLDHIEQMIDTAHQVGKVLFMGFHSRYNPNIPMARHHLDGKDITGIDIRYSEDVLYYHKDGGWIFDPAIAGGGVLMDSGVNALSMIEELRPGIEYKVTDASLQIPDDFSVETKADVTFSFGTERHGTLSMDWMSDTEQRQISFATSDGDTLTLDIVKNQMTRNGQFLDGTPDSEQSRVDWLGEYRAMYREFARHIRTAKSLTSTSELSFISQAYDIARA